MEVEHQHLKEKKNKDDKDEYETVKEIETINSLIPLWKRDKNKITDEEYETFYKDKFNDYETPILNELAAYGEKFTGGTSEYSKQHTFSFENFGNLVSDVAL